MSWTPTDLLPAREAARLRPTKPAASMLLVTLVLLFGSFLLWAHLVEIDEITRAQGQVVPSLKTQVIQNLEGGILAEMLVKEGDLVKPGQTLLRIDSTLADSQYQKSRSEYLSLLGDIARLLAEANGKGEPVFPKELQREAPEVVKTEKRFFRTRMEGLASTINILEGQAFQRRQEIAELKSKIQGLEKSLDLLKQELDLNLPLLATGAISQTEILRMQRMYAGMEGEINTAKLTLPRVQAALDEALKKVTAKQLEAKSDALDQLNNMEARLAVVGKLATAEQDRVRRTAVTSPVLGMVKQIRFGTQGAIIKPGESIMEIIPVEKSLLIEAWVKPQDIAFLRPGLPGAIRITAYDSEVYGVLDANLETISGDTFNDGHGNSFYRIHMRTTSKGFKRNGKDLPIIPGMTAMVDIITGKRTILAYIIKPVTRSCELALRER